MKIIKLLLIALLFSFSSCKYDFQETKMIKKFEKEYKKTMNDPQSLEVVDFKIIQKPNQRSEFETRFLAAVRKNVKNKSVTRERYDQIVDSVSDSHANEIGYYDTTAIITARQKNSYNAIITKDHIVMFSGSGYLTYIDGVSVFFSANPQP